jgi:hypothetical protein
MLLKTTRYFRLCLLLPIPVLLLMLLGQPPAEAISMLHEIVGPPYLVFAALFAWQLGGVCSLRALCWRLGLAPLFYLPVQFGWVMVWLRLIGPDRLLEVAPTMLLWVAIPVLVVGYLCGAIALLAYLLLRRAGWVQPLQQS